MSRVGFIYPFSTSWIDYPDKDSLALVIYFTGCIHNCKQCHNTDLQVHTEIELDDYINIINIQLIRHRTEKLVLSGGDPLDPRNIEITKKILKHVCCDICIYTGYNVKYVKKQQVVGFKFLKCGKYKPRAKKQNPHSNPPTPQTQKTDAGLTLASPNQKLYNDKFKLVSENGTYCFPKEPVHDQ